VRLRLGVGLAVLAAVAVAAPAGRPDELAAILRTHPEWFSPVLEKAGEHRLQILYTQIDRDEKNRRPSARSPTGSPTNTSTRPAREAAGRRPRPREAERPGRPRLTRDTALRIEAGTPAQTAVDRDPARPTASRRSPTTSRRSSSSATTTPSTACTSSSASGRSTSGCGAAASPTRASEAARGHPRPRGEPCHQPVRLLRRGQGPLPAAPRPQPRGVDERGAAGGPPGPGFMRDGQLVEQPFDFSQSSYVSVRSLQGILRSVLFPNAVPKRERFRLTEGDYRLLYTYMSMLPRESAEPAYPTGRSTPTPT